VLRLWPDKYCAVLCPDQLQVVRCRRTFRSSVDFKVAESFAPDANGPEWLAATEAFQRFLAMPEIGTGNLGVVLSNHFVRYMLVPWSAQISTNEEFCNYAASMFADVYGEVSSGWDVCVSAERSGSPRLAAAVDLSLLSAIRVAVAKTRLRLASVQPYLMAAYNRVAQPRKEKDFVFMLVETGRACILAAQGGKWSYVSTMTAPEQPAALSFLLEREIQLADLQGESVPPFLVHAAHRHGLILPPVHGAAPLVLESKPRAGLALMSGAACELAATLA
jgi:hypothetical protein